jgi:ribosome-binding factor A
MSRLDRLSSLMRQEIAEILQLVINDERIGFISITEVEISTDLAHAKVFYSQLGSEDDKFKTIKGLQSATKKIHYELCKRINYIKTVPLLHFKFDDGIDRGFKTLEKLKDISNNDAST